MDKRAASFARDRSVVPNIFRIHLTPPSIERITAWGQDEMVRQMEEVATSHAADQGYSFVGPVEVSFLVNNNPNAPAIEIESSTRRGAAAPAASASATSGDDYLLKMAKCMRDKGIDVSDPDSNGNMQFPDTEAANKAAQECEQTVGPAPGTEDLAKPETQQDLVKATECLRKEGYDVPDPEPGKGIQLNGDIPQDVMNKCFSEIGNK